VLFSVIGIFMYLPTLFIVLQTANLPQQQQQQHIVQIARVPMWPTHTHTHWHNKYATLCSGSLFNL